MRRRGMRLFFQRGHAQALADAIGYSVNNQSKLVQFGINGLSLAKTKNSPTSAYREKIFLKNRVLSIR